MPWALYRQGKSPWYPLNRRLSGPRAVLDAVVKRKFPSPRREGLVIYIYIIFAVFRERQEDKNSELNGCKHSPNLSVKKEMNYLGFMWGLEPCVLLNFVTAAT
jgi:hypothetical protein